MSALLAALRHNATRLEIAIDYLPEDMREEYRAAAAEQMQARACVEKIINHATDSLYHHQRTNLPAGDRHRADDRLRVTLRAARADLP